MSADERTAEFCRRFGIEVPILLAPMAGASAPSLSIAIANAGGFGACGALLMRPEEILQWSRDVRASTSGPFQLNLWIPDPPPLRDAENEARWRSFLSRWGPDVPATAGDPAPRDFAAQCEALLDAAPAAVSSIMGVFPSEYVQRLKARRIAWFATATTVREARAAADAGADAIIVQGMEAGGHRGAFRAEAAARDLVGLFALLPAIVDAVTVPVVATGGIADGRGIAAALALGASAVMIGTGFLRCPEAGIHPAWADAIGRTAPEQTMLSAVFSGRPGRSIANEYVRAATSDAAPKPAPYPVQRGLTAAMRAAALEAGAVDRMQAWAGQSAALARAEPAAALVARWWSDARRIAAGLPGSRT
jgi:nitronate monooxygenase